MVMKFTKQKTPKIGLMQEKRKDQLGVTINLIPQMKNCTGNYIIGTLQMTQED